MFTVAALVPILLALIGMVVFVCREPWRRGNPAIVSYQPALESAKLMREWGAWMTTVSTAVIGANGFMLQRTGGSDPINREWAVLSVVFFAASILFAAWTLGCLPSVVSRLSDAGSSARNDIYELSLFEWIPVHVRVGAVGALQHAFFALGLYCFACFVAAPRFEREVLLKVFSFLHWPLAIFCTLAAAFLLTGLWCQRPAHVQGEGDDLESLDSTG